ncbi:polymorphic toxin type 28 domain-containing protein [Hathewaya histolytica]|uniref:Bacterial toxin 28 domain-containing protein n=1 Tax=Hathewaya histolytica TaxID=1498 RepID=A0A4U9QZZ0_HATHI|nr:polymorphic toxin type 28 domain-containing protein [Hathewaya histolytica]VTQ84239.1 Uncharacterised protein [Hathewaya histolytica]
MLVAVTVAIHSNKLLNKDREKLSKSKRNKGVTQTPELTRTQSKYIERMNNVINDHLKESDFSGALRDLEGNPVLRPDGSAFNHKKEVEDAYVGLKKITKGLGNSLKNPNLSGATRKIIQENVDKGNYYLNRIEELFKVYGGINIE